jgi:hypothetical protein
VPRILVRRKRTKSQPPRAKRRPNRTFEDFEVEQDFPGLGRKTLLLNARQIVDAEGAEESKTKLILWVIQDLSK